MSKYDVERYRYQAANTAWLIAVEVDDEISVGNARVAELNFMFVSTGRRSVYNECVFRVHSAGCVGYFRSEGPDKNPLDGTKEVIKSVMLSDLLPKKEQYDESQLGEMRSNDV